MTKDIHGFGASRLLCGTHNEPLIWEDGGVDRASILGRWYCPGCQRAFIRALTANDGATLEADEGPP